MSKTIVMVIIVAVVVLLGLGIYFVFTMNQSNNNSNPGVGKVFNIQGMKVEIIREGSGVAAKNGDYVTTHYVGTLESGAEFDSSVKRNTPFTFQLGAQRVIQGWDLGINGMKVGEQRKLTIPYELAYGADGFPPTIPPKSTLTFMVTLLNINQASAK